MPHIRLASLLWAILFATQLRFVHTLSLVFFPAIGFALGLSAINLPAMKQMFPMCTKLEDRKFDNSIRNETKIPPISQCIASAPGYWIDCMRRRWIRKYYNCLTRIGVNKFRFVIIQFVLVFTSTDVRWVLSTVAIHQCPFSMPIVWFSSNNFSVQSQMEAGRRRTSMPRTAIVAALQQILFEFFVFMGKIDFGWWFKGPINIVHFGHLETRKCTLPCGKKVSPRVHTINFYYYYNGKGRWVRGESHVILVNRTTPLEASFLRYLPRLR